MPPAYGKIKAPFLFEGGAGEAFYKRLPPLLNIDNPPRICYNKTYRTLKDRRRPT